MAPSSIRFDYGSVQLDPSSDTPKHREIYAQLREAILNGQLESGAIVPSTRELARTIGVARNTVLAAYELLAGEGFLVSRGGAGTFVAPNAARSVQPAPSRTIEPRPLSSTADVLRVWPLSPFVQRARPFQPSEPALDVFPFATWSRIVARHARTDPDRVMTNGDPAGYEPLRNQIARHLRTFRTCRCDPEQIVITTGSQMGNFLAGIALLDAGDPVWIEEPCYPDARLAYRSRTSRVIPVPVDDAGLDIDAGTALSSEPRLIYTTPSHQWPLGVFMPVQRRLALLAYAASRRVWIVEDDYDGDLRFDGTTYAALQGLDEAQRVIHLGTFSKTIFPGLRLGYAVVPSDLMTSFLAGRRIIDRFPNTMLQAAMAEFMERGLYGRHVHAMRGVYRERHELLRARLESKLAGVLVVRPAHAGTFTVTEFVDGRDDVTATKALAAAGVDAYPLSAAYIGGARKHGLLLGHAVATPDRIRKGVDEIARILGRPSTGSGCPGS